MFARGWLLAVRSPLPANVTALAGGTIFNCLTLKYEKQKQEAANNNGGVKRQTAGELRLQKGFAYWSVCLSTTDISELNLGKNTTIEFPNGKDKLLDFNVTMRPDEGYHKYAPAFRECVYLIQFQRLAVVSARSTKGQVQNQARESYRCLRDTRTHAGLSPQHRPRRKCLLEYFARRLEARAQHQLNHLWPSILVPGKRPIERTIVFLCVFVLLRADYETRSYIFFASGRVYYNPHARTKARTHARIASTFRARFSRAV
eukprot:1189232-Prorocentrum_minimum.AAC.4